MKCPHCANDNTKVIDSRPKEPYAVWRRRECLSCGIRFNTYESSEDQLMRILIRRNQGRHQNIKNVKMMLSFISDTSRLLSEETEKLIGTVNEIESAEKTKTHGRGRKGSSRSGGPPRNRSKPTAANTVLKVIQRYKKGVDVADLKSKTDFGDKKVRNILHRLHKQGLIKRSERGIYVSA